MTEQSEHASRIFDLSSFDEDRAWLMGDSPKNSEESIVHTYLKSITFILALSSLLYLAKSL